MANPPEDVTQLLQVASDGNKVALDRLVPLVHDELRAIAHNQRRREHDLQTLNTTALVHEAYLKLVDQKRVTWQNRAHFFAVAARSMRRIVIDHARERMAQKRGGGWARVDLEDLGGPDVSDEKAPGLIALNDALERLAEVDPRQSDVVTLRFFGGLSVEEAGEVLGISKATVKREWAMARAWLHREMGGSTGESDDS